MPEIVTQCVVCNKYHYTKLDADKVARWRSGEHIQNIWPEMSPDEREILISGTCPKCWDELFGGDEDVEA